MAFKGNNSMGAKSAFYNRSMYSGFAFSEKGEVNVNPAMTKNFWFLENLFYGRIRDVAGQISIIAPKEKFLLNNKGAASSAPVKTLDFVADAFSHMVIEHEKMRLNGDINADSDHLSKLKVHSGATMGHRDARGKQASINRLFITYSGLSEGRTDGIFSFDEFSPFFMDFATGVLREIPITRSSRLIGKQSSPMSSALCLEVAAFKHSKDADKSKFMDDVNFKIYKVLAANSGFAIDKNAPWRLVADIASKQMLEFASNRVPSITTAEDVLDYYFEDVMDIPGASSLEQEESPDLEIGAAAISFDMATLLGSPASSDFTAPPSSTQAPKLDEFDEFKRIMFQTYNAFILSKPIISEKSTDSDGNKITQLKKRTRESYNSIDARMGNDFWYDKYIRVKNMELNIGYSETEINKVTRNTVDLENSLDRARAMGYLKKRMTPVIASEGSLVYKTSQIEKPDQPAKDNAQSAARRKNKKIY